jgi:hypothetical protein
MKFVLFLDKAQVWGHQSQNARLDLATSSSLGLFILGMSTPLGFKPSDNYKL